jgi:peptidyl-prolyl cis-trans isomerase D
MLKLLRQKHIAKIIFWGIVILIMPAFVLWGTGNLGRTKEKGPKSVGTIDNRKVTFDDFWKSLTSIRCQIILNYFDRPKVLDELLKNKYFLARLAWDRLIMLGAARGQKIKIGDNEVISFIKSHPIFLRRGQFDDRLYEYFLKNSMGIDPRNFEEIVRENLSIAKLNDNLTKHITMTESDILDGYRKVRDRFRVRYVLFALDEFMQKIKIDDTEIRDYFEKHKDDFAGAPGEDGIPKPAGLEDSKEKIRLLLTAEKARPDAIKYVEETYLKLAEAMEKEKLSFEAACEKLGLKTGEAGAFSGLDNIEGLGTAQSLADAAVAMKDGEVSRPVETQKGAVIFKLIEIQPFDEKKFAEEKAEFSKALLIKKKNAFLENWLRGLELGATLNIDLKDWEKFYR